MDTGNYRASECAIYPHLAQATGEYGDRELRNAATKKCYDGFGCITAATGATHLDPTKASTTTNSSVLRAELQYGGDWRHLITEVGLTMSSPSLLLGSETIDGRMLLIRRARPSSPYLFLGERPFTWFLSRLGRRLTKMTLLLL